MMPTGSFEHIGEGRKGSLSDEKICLLGFTWKVLVFRSFIPMRGANLGAQRLLRRLIEVLLSEKAMRPSAFGRWVL